MERPKCIPLVGAITPPTSAGRQNIPSRGGRYRAQKESCLNWDRHIAMVPCLYRGNIYTQRKLSAWRDQKFIPLVGAITPLTCAVRHNTPSRGRQFGPRMESCVNLDTPLAMGPCLHQGNISTKKKLRVWRDQKCISLVGAITPLPYADRQNTPSRGRRYRAQNGTLSKLERSYHHGTIFAPRKY